MKGSATILIGGLGAALWAPPAAAAIETPPYMYLDTDDPRRGIYIHWRGGEGTVHYGVDDYEENTISGTNEVHLECLLPGQMYRWYVEVDGEQSEFGTFRTDPGPGHGFKLAAITDPHLDPPGEGTDKFAGTAESLDWLQTEHPDVDVLVELGDMANNGELEEMLLLLETAPAFFANTPVIVAPGNHDVGYAEIDASAHASWVSLYPHLPTTCYEDVPCTQQTGTNYFVDYGNVTFASTLRRAEGLYLDNAWWRSKAEERVANGSLRPMLFQISHIPGSEGGFTIADLQASRGVLWMSGHAHSWSYDASDTFAEAILDRVVYHHLAIVEVTAEGMVRFQWYDDFNPSASFEIDATSYVEDFGAPLPLDDRCPPAPDPTGSSGGGSTGDDDPDPPAPTTSGTPPPEPPGGGTGSDTSPPQATTSANASGGVDANEGSDSGCSCRGGAPASTGLLFLMLQLLRRRSSRPG